LKKIKNSNLHSALSQTSRTRNNIILFAILTLILFTIAITWPFAFSFKLGILTQERRFTSGDFDKISESGITDGKGTITFINSDLSVVYPSNSNLTITQEEINNMLDVEMSYQDISVYHYNKDNIDYTQIYSEGETTRTSWHLLIDEDNNYLDSENFHYIEAVYTDEDIDYIINDYVKDARTYKYYFETDDNESYYMIVQLDESIQLFEVYEIIIIITSLIVILVLVIILINSPTRKLINRLNQPINDLSEAMSNFIPGVSTLIENKYDIEEYDLIINTYNDMVLHINNLEESNSRLEENKKDMFAAIAHDLKTPITVLNGYINAMINGKISDEDYKAYYQKILLKSEQLTILINEFAAYNEMNHSKFKLNKQTIDICNFVRNYFASNYEYIDDNNFNLIVDIPEIKIDHSIDQLQFNRTFDNLLSNFIKYNPKNTTIHVEITGTTDTITIALENNGTKISNDISSTLFDPFIIDDQSRGTSSTGLGLSIVKRIIELHDGTIEYHSNDAYCNQFIIKLNK